MQNSLYSISLHRFSFTSSLGPLLRKYALQHFWKLAFCDVRKGTGSNKPRPDKCWPDHLTAALFMLGFHKRGTSNEASAL